ncbi:uncharacterized protein LOC128931710 isoform X2 [Callithrix jacchus]
MTQKHREGAELSCRHPGLKALPPERTVQIWNHCHGQLSKERGPDDALQENRAGPGTPHFCSFVPAAETWEGPAWHTAHWGGPTAASGLPYPRCFPAREAPSSSDTFCCHVTWPLTITALTSPGWVCPYHSWPHLFI